MTYKALMQAGELGEKVNLVDALNIPAHVQEANQKRAKSMIAYLSKVDN